MSNIWTNEREATLMEALSSYAEYESEASIQDAIAGTSGPWNALLYPLNGVSGSSPTGIDENAQIHAHVPSGLNDQLWGLPEYSFGIPQVSAFQLQSLSSSAHTDNYFLGEPYFDQEYGQEIQGIPTPENRGSVAPNDQLVKASKEIIKIMTSFKVLPNQDMAKHNLKISQAKKTLNDYVFSLHQEKREMLIILNKV
ncbi:hypothetical protein BJ165DRAFT_1524815 [Panaeolus papilionaceus]|nr:hypothetical protein BJ165DRAFT_1524815 [Panaeolus papilionaceus]